MRSSSDSCTASASHDIDSRPISRGSATAVIVKTSLAMRCLTVRLTLASETPRDCATAVNGTRPSSCSARNTAASNAVSGSGSGGSAGTRGNRGIARTLRRQELDADLVAAVEELDDGRVQHALAVLAPGLTAVVPPRRGHAGHSWMWPCSDSIGRKPSQASRTAVEPAARSPPMMGRGG